MLTKRDLLQVDEIERLQGPAFKLKVPNVPIFRYESERMEVLPIDPASAQAQPKPHKVNRESMLSNTLPTTPPDVELLLFSRLVECVLRWPCPKCGKPGLCYCFDAPAVEYSRETFQAADLNNVRTVCPSNNGSPENGYSNRTAIAELAAEVDDSILAMLAMPENVIDHTLE